MKSNAVEVLPNEETTTVENASEVANFLAERLPANRPGGQDPAIALVPWMCDVLLSEKSMEAYGTDLAQFAQYANEHHVGLYEVTADDVKVYKAWLIKMGVRPASVARKLSVIRGAYQQFANKGFVTWQVSQGISAIKAPPVKKNSTPSLTQQQATGFLAAIPCNSIQGVRDLAMFQTLFITGCRVSAICGARVGDLEFDGVEYYLHVQEKRAKESRKILLDVARSVIKYIEKAMIEDDREGPLFRPLSPDGLSFVPRHMHRQTPWRLVKKYCRTAGIDPQRLTGRGIGVHSLRKTAITDAIRNGAKMHEVREFAGHSDIRTTELYYQRRDEDAEVAARCIRIRQL